MGGHFFQDGQGVIALRLRAAGQDGRAEDNAGREGAPNKIQCDH